MKLSKGFWQTYKEVPSDATIASHILMTRAGLIHKSANGIYNYLPMGLRSIKKVEQIIREELTKADCYELQMSTITPGDLWQESGRWDKMSGQMLKMKDNGGRDLCYSPTNEEAITDIFRKTVKSYKNLPVTLYQINTKFRDEIRPRYGLMRGREFTMKDGYSFHISRECMKESYQKMYDVYEMIFNRMGLKYIAVEADGGAMADGDSRTHEFQVLASSGEDSVIHCPSCEYAANIERATTKRAFLNTGKSDLAMEVIDTQDATTIEDVCTMLNTPQSASLKALLYTTIVEDKPHLVLFMVLGDDNINELKINKLVHCEHIAPATDSEMLAAGIPKGHIGPHSLPEGIEVFFDKEIDINAAYCVGAMKVQKHVINFIPSRDACEFKTADLRESKAGDLCCNCNKNVEEIRGIEVGQVFELGDKYTKSMGATILDHNGKTAHPFMGCYGIGVTRTVAAAIEQNHDENGIIWPASIAPYHLYFAVIAKSDETKALAEEIYNDLLSAGIEVVYDDRKAGAGFKFKDADLLGLPIRLVLGERDFKESGLLEIKSRKSGEIKKVSQKELITTVTDLLKEL
ncbi:MAG: proline--tRNA ligase [Bacteriovoracaceae bacterium]|nr:proline--tRNA ligase [Bacteriovoracaceae bacterium]